MTSTKQQNYSMACGVAAITDALLILMQSNIEVRRVHVVNGRGYIFSNDARSCPGIQCTQQLEIAGRVRCKAQLMGCVVEFYQTDMEQVA